MANYDLGTARGRIVIDGDVGELDKVGSGLDGVATKSTSMASVVSGAFSTMAGSAAAFLGVVGGLAISGGIARQLKIEDATAKLRGLGHEAESVDLIMESALKSVEGTAYGLDSAASIAASAVAAGIEPGQELEKYLRLTADAATIAGTSMEEMGSIINKTTTAGKVQADNLNQLADRGIPIFQWLAEEMGVTQEKLREMVSKGEVDSETFRAAIEKNIGGAALESGATTRGAFANMMAALSRTGQALTRGIFPFFKDFFNQIQEGLGNLNAVIGPVFDQIGAVAGPKLVAFGEMINKFLSNIKLDGLISSFSGLGPLLTPILGGLAGLLGPLLTNIPIIGKLFQGLTGPVGIFIGLIAAMLQASPKLREVLGTAFEELGGIMEGLTPTFDTLAEVANVVLAALGDTLADLILALLPPFIDILNALLPVVVELAPIIGELAAQLGGTLGDAIAVVAPVLADLVTNLLDLIDPLLTGENAAFLLGAAFAGWALAQVLPTIIAVTTKIITMTAAMVKNTLAFIRNTAAQIASKAQTIALAALYAGSFLANLARQTAALAANTLAWIRNTATQIAAKAAAAGSWLLGIITSLGSQTAALAVNAAAWVRNTAAQIAAKATAAGGWLLGLVTAVGSQTAALAVNSAAWVRNTAAQVASKVAMVATRVAMVAATAAQWLFNAALSANPIGLIIAGIAALVAGLIWFFTQTELGQQIVQTVWAAIQTAVAAVVDWFQNTLLPFFQGLWAGMVEIWNGISTAVSTGIQTAYNFVVSVLNAIAAFWSGVWNGIVSVVTTIWNWIVTTVTNGINNAKNTVQSVLNTISALWSAGWNAVSSFLSGLWETLKSTVSNGINAAKNTISSVIETVKSLWSSGWNSIKSTVDTIWESIKTSVTNGVNSAKDTVVGLKDKVINALSGAATWLFDSGKAIIQGLIDGIKNMGANVSSAVSGVLQSARNLLPFSPAKEGPFSGKGWTLYSGRSIVQALAQGVEDEEGTFVGATERVLGAADWSTERYPMPNIPEVAVNAAPQQGSMVPEIIRFEIPVIMDGREVANVTREWDRSLL